MVAPAFTSDRDAEKWRGLNGTEFASLTIQQKEEAMPDKVLQLKWWQIAILKEQIETAEKGAELGRAGKITTNSECTVEWDGMNVKLEIPEEEPEEPTTDFGEHGL